MTGVLLLAALLASPARAQSPQPLPGAELVDLLEVDFNRRPELKPLAAALTATFQLFTRRQPKPGTTDDRARPPAEEGGPDLIAVCTGSFIGPTSVVTADHCVSRDRQDIAGRLVLRRHLFTLQHGRLKRAGYEDYALSGAVLENSNDLAVLELSVNTPAPADVQFRRPPEKFKYAPGTSFHALGYPSDGYAAPRLSYGCRIAVPTRADVEPSVQYQADCRIVGGMSGGPQFMAGRTQIGVNSMSQERGATLDSVSPRLAKTPKKEL